uniref:Uncharacterized protein n=1 Tax=Setaria viridis TaxID=4556 RepID=A0A4U6U4W4_SETVI|nr:hypothetical protein SEVIR_6G136200v2 [Setaria viridis]
MKICNQRMTHLSQKKKGVHLVVPTNSRKKIVFSVAGKNTKSLHPNHPRAAGKDM